MLNGLVSLYDAYDDANDYGVATTNIVVVSMWVSPPKCSLFYVCDRYDDNDDTDLDLDSKSGKRESERQFVASPSLCLSILYVSCRSLP
mmetsp:Transcript_8525/g.9777  ORF Transcript_8525/g.9777 Transcript_8525/m.9777 type:complete len:89 (-) Transcript_8525:122-388(-)